MKRKPAHLDETSPVAEDRSKGMHERNGKARRRRNVDESPPDQHGDAWEGPEPDQRHGATVDEKSSDGNYESAPKQESSEVWPAPSPIPDGLPAVLPFNYEMLPKCFFDFVSDIASRMQVPPDFPAVAIMIVEATVLGRKVCIRPKRHDDWSVVPNLWGAIIGRPGIMKSPASKDALKFLHRLEKESKERFENEMLEYEAEKEVATAQEKRRSEAVLKAIKEGGDPKETYKQIDVAIPKEPTRRRLVVNDSTVEKLGDLLNKNANGLMVFRDELSGLLAGLGREGQEGARAFYLEAWDGTGKFTYDRMSRGTLEIESVTLSILGGIQPGVLTNVLRGAVEGGTGDDGLMQRFQLAVYPDVEKDWKNVDRWPDAAANDRVWESLHRLDGLSATEAIAQTDADIPYVRFDAKAQVLFDNWRKVLEQRIRSGEDHPAIESHLSKYRSLVPSLALLIHLADGGKGNVTADPTSRAILWAHYLESHARRIYAIIVDPSNNAAKALEKRITRGELPDRFTVRDVYRKGWAGLDKQSAELGVEALEDLGWLKKVEQPTEGKPRTIYRIHPSKLAGGENAGVKP